MPGIGVIAAQAATSFRGRDQARNWIQQGIGAAEVLKRLSDPEFYSGWFLTKFSDLQYGVATLGNGGFAGNIGGDNLIPWSGGLTGRHYSVQGNTLRGINVITAASRAFKEQKIGSCRLTLGERLMRALEAGASALPRGFAFWYINRLCLNCLILEV